MTKRSTGRESRFVGEFTEIARACLSKCGLAPALANEAAMQLATDLCYRWGGGDIYVPRSASDAKDSIFPMWSAGKTPREIANALGVSERYVQIVVKKTRQHLADGATQRASEAALGNSTKGGTSIA